MLGRYADPDTARGPLCTIAEALAGLGFNVNFGPVVDLDVEACQSDHLPAPARLCEERPDRDRPSPAPSSSRTGGRHPHAPKHFPGHGSTVLDSHRVLPDITLTWSEAELEPYRALLAEDLADMVMVGHLVLRSRRCQRPPRHALAGNRHRPPAARPRL